MKTFFFNFFFFGDRLKNFCEELFFFFEEHLTPPLPIIIPAKNK